MSVDETITDLILALTNSDINSRENALLELSKKRDDYNDLAPLLWYSCGTMTVLLQEIIGVYPFLNPPTLTATASNRVCNALALLQSVASHPDTRNLFLDAHIPLFLFPFLSTNNRGKAFEYLRLTSLGVIGALVKMDDSRVVKFLLNTDIVLLCLRIMGIGSELSKTVATFIIQKILLDEYGLADICSTADKFYSVADALKKVVDSLQANPSLRLLKHIIRCYLRLTDHPKARSALRTILPTPLRNNTFAELLEKDATASRWLTQILRSAPSADA